MADSGAQDPAAQGPGASEGQDGIASIGGIEINAGHYRSVQVVPKEEEKGDANFPPNLAAAMELFGMLNLREHADRCKKCVDRYIEVLEKGPDGVTNHQLGRGAICWECGHVGLPKNASECLEETSGVLAKCGNCGSSDQTNFVAPKNHDASLLPWIEVKETDGSAEKAASKIEKVGRNDECPCNSGKKYKKCCGGA